MKGPVSSTWVAVHNSNLSFIRLAQDDIVTDEGRLRSGSKLPLTKIASGQKSVDEILNLATKIPAPIFKIPIRADRNYRSVPVLTKIEPYFTVAVVHQPRGSSQPSPRTGVA